MDAVALFRRDHDRVRELLSALADPREAEPRLEAVREIGAELILHAQLEEEFLYTPMEKAGDPEAHQLSLEARVAHGLVEDLLERLFDMDPRGTAFARAVVELERDVQQHVRDEEVRIYPVAERVLGLDRLAALGDEVHRRRARLDAAA